jgi:hypothetical protein
MDWHLKHRYREKYTLMSDEIYILDDFVPNDVLSYAQRTVLRDDLDWNLYLSTVTGNDDTHQFVLGIQNEKEVKKQHLIHLFTDCLQPHIEKELDRKVKSLLRCKLNLISPLTLGQPNIHHTPHIDVEYDDVRDDVYSMVFHYFDSDGPTCFFDDDGKIATSIDPKEGRAIVFHYNQRHASTSPRHTQLRLVMNAVFVLE